MHYIDLGIFVGYMLIMLGVGYYFMRKNKNQDDYYVGGRDIGSWHIGLSVVATDVGGGFSVGLGGLGFVMGLSGSWMLFTGLLGAWLAAVFLIPRVKQDKAFAEFYTFPQIFKYLFDKKVGIVAAVICLIGYLGFTSSQLLAGAKLASGTFEELEINQALWIMGVIAVVYTVLGGLKAVIYTDTVQWIILMLGFIFIGLPFAYFHVGGWEVIKETLPNEFFTLTNLRWQDFANWGITILPIWFIGMTLYQRIFASRDTASAKKAWFIAGLFEWPIMAFMGVLLGLFAKVAFQQGMFAELGFAAGSDIDPEMGLPLLLRSILPIGLMGIMMAAYFSAIMSTADSCLMAASGNIVTDIFGKYFLNGKMDILRWSQIVTFIVGAVAIMIASTLESVLDLMLLSYSFMVSGLLVPVIGAFFWKESSAFGAGAAMIAGGGVTIAINYSNVETPLGLDPNFFGLSASLFVFIIFSKLIPGKEKVKIEKV